MDAVTSPAVMARARLLFVGLQLSVCLAAKADGSSVPIARQAAKPVPTLCGAGEEPVFSCGVSGQRIVSACASAGLSPSAGSLIYKLGKSGKADIVLPASTDGWRQQVSWGQVMYAGGGGSYLRFNAEPYTYVVYSAVGRGWGEKNGVMVLNDGRMASFHRCLGRVQSELGPALFQRAGVAEDREALVLPPP
jgi:hypothetical protein